MLSACPVCEGRDLFRFDQVPRGEEAADIYACGQCSAILNCAAYSAAAASSAEAIQISDYRDVNDRTPQEHLAEIKVGESIVDTLLELSGFRAPNAFFDFGCGRGYTALAMSERCKRVIACEWVTRPVHRILSDFPGRFANVDVISDPGEVTEPADCLHMWHVLEHLAQPTQFWRQHARTLTPDATIFVQVPMYRPDYIVDCHYIFYNERSLTAWARKLSAEPTRFVFEPKVGFITMMAMRRG